MEHAVAVPRNFLEPVAEDVGNVVQLKCSRHILLYDFSHWQG
jgi:hypothetical protein